MSCADWGKSVIGVVKKTELPEPGPHCPFRRLVPHERQEDARVASLLGNHNCGSVRHLRKVLITQLDELLLLRLPGYGYLLTSPDVGQVVIGRKTETSPSWMITS